MIDLPLFSYGALIVDPPWKLELWSAAGEQKAPQHHYRCLELEEIKALPIGHLAGKDAVVMLWATFPMLEPAFDVLRAWGFRYVTGGAWGKRTKHGKQAFGTGYVLRSAAEVFLIGATGEPEYGSKSVRNWIDAPAREHSRKPDEQYDIMEELVPGVRRAEIFATQRRDGWDAWGDQLGKFEEAA